MENVYIGELYSNKKESISTLLKVAVTLYGNYRELSSTLTDMSNYHLLSLNEKQCLSDFCLNKKSFNIIDPQKIKILEKLKLPNSLRDKYKVELDTIIFNIVVDSSGDLYAREIITGYMFPIIDYSKNVVCEYELEKNNYTGASYINIHGVYKVDAIKDAVDVYIKDYKYCNKEEHNKYIKDKNSIEWKNTLRDYYQNNEFNRPVNPVIIEERKEKTKELKLMEEIEYYISLIKNNELKISYLKKYNLLLKDSKINNESILIEFLYEVKLSSFVNSNNSEEFITYLDKLFNEEYDLLYIYHINTLFLSLIDNYTNEEASIIMNKLSDLYLKYLFLNINEIDTNLLKNSYIFDNLKYIIVSLSRFNIECDLSSIKTVDDLVSIIKNNSGKTLIRK